jgi:hypothetical protein
LGRKEELLIARKIKSTYLCPKAPDMKKGGLILLFVLFCFLFTRQDARGQCSICTRTAQQQGERPAKALNAGILYLAFMPLAIVGFLGYRWWRSYRQEEG